MAISHQILDGCIEQGEQLNFKVPIRGTSALSPTLKNVFNKFSVKYLAQFVLTTQEEREEKEEEQKPEKFTLSEPIELFLWR